MKKGELLALNHIMGKVTIPEMTPDELYDYLSVKADMEKEVEVLNAKIEIFRKETKPEDVDENDIQEGDPKVEEWNRKYSEMYSRLLNEEHMAELPKCITRNVFPHIAKGMTTNEAVLLRKYLVKD